MQTLKQLSAAAESLPALAELAYERYGIELMVRRRPDQGGGTFPETGNWRLLLRGPVADVWSRKGPNLAPRLRALAATMGGAGEAQPGP